MLKREGTPMPDDTRRRYQRIQPGDAVTGARVRYIRESLGLTMRDVARVTSIWPPDVSRIEVGSRKAWPQARREIAAALGVSVTTIWPEGDREDGHAPDA